MLQVTYFITNICFVASLIFTLFIHRSVTVLKSADRATDNTNKLKQKILLRTVLIVLTIIFFVSMCASFLLDMYTNG